MHVCEDENKVYTIRFLGTIQTCTFNNFTFKHLLLKPLPFKLFTVFFTVLLLTSVHLWGSVKNDRSFEIEGLIMIKH